MATGRVQAVFQGGSLLPEDRFINTFHFTSAEPLFSVAKDIFASAVGSFYLATHSSAHVGQFLSPWVQRAFTTNVYDLELPEGEREPYTSGWTLPTSGAEGLPEEVAVCLTVHGVPPVTPRRRGRIYIGPLVIASQVFTAASSGSMSRVTTSGAQNIALVLGQAAADLKADASCTWCIRSVTPTENFVPIDAGWVDNTFDIIRKRGPDPTSRRVWDDSDAGVT